MSPSPQRSPITSNITQVDASDATLLDGAAKSKRDQDLLRTITDFFDLDDRPTLILDLETTPNPTLVYHNGSLGRLRRTGLEVGSRVTEYFGSTYEEGKVMSFLNWACNENSHAAIYWDMQWTTRSWRHRWKIVTGAPEQEKRRSSISAEPSKLSRQSTDTFLSTNGSRINYPAYRPLDLQITEFRSRQEEISLSTAKDDEYQTLDKDTTEDNFTAIGPFDYTAPAPTMAISGFHQFFRQFDWASTPLGPMSSWPVTLRRMVNMMLADPRPSAFYWGPSHVMVYNEPYCVVMSQRHPHMMGKPFDKAFADSPQVIEGFIPAFENSTKTGVAFAADDALFYLERFGYLEET